MIMGAAKPVMLVAVDDTRHSLYALEWTLDHFFSTQSHHPFQLACVSARAPASLVCPTAGPMGPTNTEGLEIVGDELKRAAERVSRKAKEICRSRVVKDVVVEVCEGDPRLVICQAVDKHHAAILVVGSHGYGALKRAVLGSVSDYCAHHANCAVLIAKEPKQLM